MSQTQIRALKKAKPEPDNNLSQEQPTQEKEPTSETANTSEKQSISETLQKPNEQQKDGNPEEETERYFHAVGILEAEISFDEQEDRAYVALSGKQYPLLHLPGEKYKLWGLQKRIKATGSSIKRLIVYPRAIHLPDKESRQQIQFQLLRFEESETRYGVSQHLANMEFQLSGLWQFIPVCRVPCISVFRNYSKERLNWIKSLDPKKRVRYLKPAHLPVLWKAPVKPFKYNPKAETQKKVAFVAIKAKFLPHKDAFGFESLLQEPTTENIPKYLKPSKKDKQQAQKQQTENTSSHTNKASKNINQSKQNLNDNDKPSTDNIELIAKQIENRNEIAKQNQEKQAEIISNLLISNNIKDNSYSLPKNYISNWKHGRNIPKETGKHYSAYSLWQSIINASSE